MTEPGTSTSFVVLGAATALLGPVLGPFALLVFGAVAGSLLALGTSEPMTRWQAARFVAVGVAVALALTGLAVWLVERYTDVPGHLALMPLAFAFAAGREHLSGFIKRLLDGLATAAEHFFSRGAK